MILDLTLALANFMKAMAAGVLLLALASRPVLALTVGEVVKDLACPCECPLVLEDCNMTCGLDWKEQVGEMIKKGMSKQEIIDYFTATYGEDARLTTLQKIHGKAYQITRGFGQMEWALLFGGAGIWALILFFGIYLGVKKLRTRA